jgi:hypothetical protein
MGMMITITKGRRKTMTEADGAVETVVAPSEEATAPPDPKAPLVSPASSTATATKKAANSS